MAYYDALITKWPSISGATTADKLASLNALTAPGPNTDVSVSSALAVLMLSSAYVPLSLFAQSGPSGVALHDNALVATKMLMAMVSAPNAPSFGMSSASTHAIVKSMMDAILAQETAQPNTTGFTQAVHDELLALSDTIVPWWRANGYPRPFDMGDIAAAGVN